MFILGNSYFHDHAITCFQPGPERGVQNKILDFSTRIQYIYFLKNCLGTCFCIADSLFSRNFGFYSDSSDNTKTHIIDEDSNLVRNKYEEESIVKKCALIM